MIIIVPSPKSGLKIKFSGVFSITGKSFNVKYLGTSLVGRNFSMIRGDVRLVQVAANSILNDNSTSYMMSVASCLLGLSKQTVPIWNKCTLIALNSFLSSFPQLGKWYRHLPPK